MRISAMSWTWLVVEFSPADALANPRYGPEYADRAAAHAVAADLLAGMDAPQEIVDAWARGARDDAVFFGTAAIPLVVVALVEHLPGDPGPAVMAWLDDFVTTMRSTGVDAVLGSLPEPR